MRRLLLAVLLLLPPAASAQNFGNIPPQTVIGNSSLTATKPAAPMPLSTFGGIPGAVGDGTAQDGPAFVTYLATLPATGGTVYLSPFDKHRIDSITVPPNVTINCQGSPRMVDIPTAAPKALHKLGGFRLNPGATISLSAGSRLEHCYIQPFGVTFPVANPSAYAETAVKSVTGDPPDIWLTDVLIVGFAVGFDGTSGTDRLHLIDVEVDAINGYIIGPLQDSGEIRGVRCWPWGTNSVSTRSGTCMNITGATRVDDLKVSGFTDFGHAVGLSINNAGGSCCNFYLENVWLDNNATHALVLASGGVVTFGKLWLLTTGGTEIDATGAGKFYVADLQVNSATAGNCVSGAGAVTVGYLVTDGTCTDNFGRLSIPGANLTGTTLATGITTAAGLRTVGALANGMVLAQNPTYGAILQGNGSGNDVCLFNSASATVACIPHATSDFAVIGGLSAGIAAAAGNDLACYNTTNGKFTYASSVVGCVPSALRFKTLKGTIDPAFALAAVAGTTPSIYSYKPETGLMPGRDMDGLLADDLCAIDERLCHRDAEGRIDNYDKSGALAYAYAAIKQLEKEVASLKSKRRAAR